MRKWMRALWSSGAAPTMRNDWNGTMQTTASIQGNNNRCSPCCGRNNPQPRLRQRPFLPVPRQCRPSHSRQSQSRPFKPAHLLGLGGTGIATVGLSNNSTRKRLCSIDTAVSRPNGPPKTPTTPLPSVTDLLRGTRSDYSQSISQPAQIHNPIHHHQPNTTNNNISNNTSNINIETAHLIFMPRMRLLCYRRNKCHDQRVDL
ncbi:hypothetical protein BCR33DRAFT_455318 [Rhizoclosmatium globosum]|uniref:Uncharacterized protein n=1 Tax=Rhizoclosmatium globosum TaxID=329046 RepID=A0A1Y2CWQ0_9FUNG|nr:hypothetical protein BCR33DRAFT_455318 [Rhizoclosmatium globosum]|eukprot:ORY51461.1 hypothetical protein BCR33DRAFT_455318 [Rhizoclosmatium globosum]